MERPDPKILIVGAGPTGLTAAVEFARYGIAVRIIDRNDGPTRLSKAVGVSAHSLDLLEVSGVAAGLLAEGVKVRRAHVWSGGRELGQIAFSVLRHRFDFLLSLPQSETETIMAGVLDASGVEVERQTTFVGLEQDGDGVRVSLDGPRGRESARFDTVYGADGAHSAVRDAIGLDFAGYEHERLWSIADIEMAGWSADPTGAHLFFHRGGDVGFIIPVGGIRFRAFSNTADALARIPGASRLARVLLTDTFHIPVRQAATYQQGHVYLGGDAAHVHSPVGARGMNLGIEDAASFVRRFVADELDGYTAERHPVGKRWIALSERALSVAQADGMITAGLRNLAVRIVGNIPPLQRPLLERMAGLRE